MNDDDQIFCRHCGNIPNDDCSCVATLLNDDPRHVEVAKRWLAAHRLRCGCDVGAHSCQVCR